jgi:hypothetical protein
MNPEPAVNTSNNILNQGVQNVSDAFSSVKNQVSDAINGFSDQPNASSEFSFSNTIIAKFAFLLLIIILFMYFINYSYINGCKGVKCGCGSVERMGVGGDTDT